MDRFTFETQGSNTFLVYHLAETDKIDSLSLGMVKNNRIPGIAPVVYTQMNEEKYLKYNITAKVSLQQFFTGAVNGKRLLTVFSGICTALLSAEEYMIDASSFVMDPNYIFVDVTTYETYLICLPLSGSSSSKLDIGSFFKNIMFATQFDQTEDCGYVAQIINYLNSKSVCILADFKQLTDSLRMPRAVAPAKAVNPAAQQQKIPTPPPSPVQQAVPERQDPAHLTMNGREVSPLRQMNPDPAPQSPPTRPQNFSIPAAPQQQPVPGPRQEKMSMFYLMTHYSKKNKLQYDAQKRSEASAQGAVQREAPLMPKNAQRQTFAVPGQQLQTVAPRAAGQAIPVSPAANPCFSIPSQQSVPVVKCPEPAASFAKQPPAPPVGAGFGTPFPPANQVSVKSASADFGETTVLNSEIGGTTVLSGNPLIHTAQQPYLIRAKNNEKIPLDKPIFRIGKEKSYVDYFISDNTAISRSHANIITREKKYYLVDTNSTNHTFVNGQMIPANMEVEISEGMRFRLANEDFTFHLN